MSKKSTIARCAGTAAAVRRNYRPGCGRASPPPTHRRRPRPQGVAGVDGDVIDMTVTQTSAGQNALCLPIVLNATDALPLARCRPISGPGSANS